MRQLAPSAKLDPDTTRGEESRDRQIKNSFDPARELASCNQDRVGAQRAACGLRMAPKPVMDSAAYAALFRGRDRQSGCFDIRPGFHLDKNDQPSSLRNDIDFAALHAIVAIENSKKAPTQPQRRERLGAQAESAGCAFGLTHLS